MPAHGSLVGRIGRRILRWRSKPRAVHWGNLRRLKPVSAVFGFDRGRCIDRFYIEQFLERHSADIRGHVLEVAETTYTARYGGDRVHVSHVLHVSDGNPCATAVADLTDLSSFPADWIGAFDCLILTQTLPFIYDVASAVRGCYGLLSPGGVLLGSVPCISQISRYDAERWGDYWRFTPQSTARLFGDTFGASHVQLEAHGNVLAACAFLHGLAAHELAAGELQTHDADYPVVITVRAVKPPCAPA